MLPAFQQIGKSILSIESKNGDESNVIKWLWII